MEAEGYFVLRELHEVAFATVWRKISRVVKVVNHRREKICMPYLWNTSNSTKPAQRSFIMIHHFYEICCMDDIIRSIGCDLKIARYIIQMKILSSMKMVREKCIP